MEPINVNLSCDIQQPVKVRYLDGYFFSKDSAGHRINVDVFDNGVPVSVGGSVSAEVIRSDGETVPVTGAVSENRAYVILPQAAYAVVGAVQITIKVTEGTTIVTIACFVAYVHESDTEITVDPGNIIPSIQALISQIETAVASIPADYSSLWTSLAPAFSSSTAYAVGQYVTNSGVLYRFTTAHPAGTWNSAHVTAVNLGSDISALKSAFSGRNYAPLATIAGSVNTDGTSRNSTSIDSTYKRTDYIEVRQGDVVYYNRIKSINSNVIVAVYDSSKVFDSSLSVVGKGSSVEVSDKVVIQNDGFVRLSGTNGSLAAGYFKIAATDDELATIGKAADAGAIRDVINDNFTNETKGLYEEQYNKATVTTTWKSGQLKKDGSLRDITTKYISTGYIAVYGSLPIEISAPDNIKLIVLKYSSNTTVSSFAGIARDYSIGNQRVYVDSNYFRICACYADGSDISESDASSITIAQYADQRADDVAFSLNVLNETLEKTPKSTTWEQGKISVTIDPETGQGTASLVSSTKHIRSNYIALKAGSAVRIDFPKDKISITVYEYDAQSAVGYTDTLTSENASGYFVYNEADFASIRIVAKYVSDDNILPAAGADITITLYSTKKEFNILVLGNSFSQDSFAYLPPVLNEALPEYVVNYGVAYTSSTSIQDHINYYNNETKYTSYREWSYKAGAWKLYTSSGDYDHGKTLADIMALRNWDIIYVQPASRVAGDDTHTAAWYVQNRIIYPGRKLLEILKSLSSKPFAYLMGEWLATDSDGDHGVEVFGLLADALELTENSLGIDGVIPIGAAFQNARSNTTLQALGDATIHNMLCTDGQHMQSGIPALLATYTIANYILRLMGMKRSIHGSSFVPTDENCIAIKAWKANDANPKMTHGSSVGVADESVTANMNAAQEIAIMAVRKPYEITDCADIFTDTYTPES